jgi:raffinose/stachyose/melibiose transport system substrate-binding protein
VKNIKKYIHKNKKILVFSSIAIVLLMGFIVLYTNLGKKDEEATLIDGVSSSIDATITFATYSKSSMELYKSLNLEERFQDIYPNVNIEIEEFESQEDYFKAMQVRASAGQLPDVLFTKNMTLSYLKNFLEPLDDSLSETIKHNKFVDDYRIDGKVYGIPSVMACQYLYYWDDMLAELDIKAPCTINELIDAIGKLEDYYGNPNSATYIEDYIPLVLNNRGSEGISVYSQTYLASYTGDGNVWNNILKDKYAFVKGGKFYNAYKNVYNLLSLPYVGQSSLEMNGEAALTLFANHKATFINGDQNQLRKIRDKESDLSHLKVIFLPCREDTESPFFVPFLGDDMLSVSKSCEHKELAQAFIKFYFGKSWYPYFINSLAYDTTMDNFPVYEKAYIDHAMIYQPNYQGFVYGICNDDYNSLMHYVNLDFNDLCRSMILPDFNFTTRME